MSKLLRAQREYENSACLFHHRDQGRLSAALSGEVIRVGDRHEVSVEKITAAIVTAASREAVDDPLLRKVLEEWGDLLT